eukprot:CAMPEP_0114584340 /NCGR_PEP_ID=MMETSP0125-20121206/8052_1 /TAXON_ID=485358 ORGANISM="Aristerostoma sp., Strain ATCC 50986" /NCGR_SAMPLE_ID=MMETSP0125 /ASSEMBLY_ACC=CAM_ASM_000245 /LENGTH=194 /DNA_ID=CAMNT_0001778657 /DNA_START=747 /DNA_END=1328 /DNA_ORIENTATION=-
MIASKIKKFEKKAMQEADGKEVDKDENKGKFRDLIELLAEQRWKNGFSSAHSLNEDEIIDEFCMLYLGGKDTVTIFISMAMHCLAKFPKWKKLILAEIHNMLKTEGGQVTYERINKLDYLTAFLKEVLRMFPPSPGSSSRVAKMDHDIGDIRVRADTLVYTNFLGNHFNSQYFKRPNEFNPERFLDLEKWSDKW